jgi:hypothetical protein
MCNLTSSHNVSTLAVPGPPISNLTSYLILSHNITSHLSITSHLTTLNYFYILKSSCKGYQDKILKSYLYHFTSTIYQGYEFVPYSLYDGEGQSWYGAEFKIRDESEILALCILFSSALLFGLLTLFICSPYDIFFMHYNRNIYTCISYIIYIHFLIH